MTEGQDRKVEVIFSPEDIGSRVRELAEEIKAAGLDRLIRALHDVGLSPEVDFISLSSYRSATRSSGRVEILRDIDLDVSERNVLLIDDILESGRTLAYAKDLMAARGARSVTTCVLLRKKTRRAVAIDADFYAFDCPEVFVAGYGMDVAYRYRQLPFVGYIPRTP